MSQPNLNRRDFDLRIQNVLSRIVLDRGIALGSISHIREAGAKPIESGNSCTDSSCNGQERSMAEIHVHASIIANGSRSDAQRKNCCF